MYITFSSQFPAYHGSKLIVIDCVGMMPNADETFTYFAGILKINKKDDYPYTVGMIDEMCTDFPRLSML